MIKDPPKAAPQPDPREIEEALEFSTLLQEFGRLLSGEYDRRMPMSPIRLTDPRAAHGT
ncbi:hypothetical protein [Pyruvatibacter mobilis]|uniref:hypothetical protein n=1 Tax=Pyruvatibacter mobilis TaxID=1712261 RepID=UPI003BB0BF77